MVLHTFQGRPPIYQETLRSPALGRRLEVCCCQAQKAPGAPKGFSAANRLCALHRHLGEPSIRANNASCTSQDGAADVKPEGERGVQEGANSSPKGGRRLRPLEQKKYAHARLSDSILTWPDPSINPCLITGSYTA